MANIYDMAVDFGTDDANATVSGFVFACLCHWCGCRGHRVTNALALASASACGPRSSRSTFEPRGRAASANNRLRHSSIASVLFVD